MNLGVRAQARLTRPEAKLERVGPRLVEPEVPPAIPKDEDRPNVKSGMGTREGANLRLVHIDIVHGHARNLVTGIAKST